MRPKIVTSLQVTSGTEIAHGSRPGGVPGKPNTLRFGKRRPVSVTDKTAMSSKFLDQVAGDNSAFPGRPALAYGMVRWVHRCCHSSLVLLTIGCGFASD